MSDYQKELCDIYLDARQHPMPERRDQQEWAKALDRGDQSDKDVMVLIAERDNFSAALEATTEEYSRIMQSLARWTELRASLKAAGEYAAEWFAEYGPSLELVEARMREFVKKARKV
jgi:small-conductance mechanosensitive channel